MIRPAEVRLGLVLSAGGLRGAAHLGVLRHLLRDGIPLEVIVGVSAGAIIAGYYAAVGVDIDDLVADARTFRGRHLLAHSLNVRLSDRFGDALRPLCGVIPNRLMQTRSGELRAAAPGRLAARYRLSRHHDGAALLLRHGR